MISGWPNDESDDEDDRLNKWCPRYIRSGTFILIL